MLVFLILAAGVWFLGRQMNQPTSVRWTVIALIYVGVVAIQVILPEGNLVRGVFGGEIAEWVAVGVIGALIWLYRVGLASLRQRVRPENRPTETGAAEVPAIGAAADTAAERYARHIILREIGGPGQKRLREARVLVLGAGGLGSPVLQYLAAAGVGTIGVIDDDIVELTNLQRQVIHTNTRIGMPKVFSAQAAITAQNPLVEIKPYHRRLTGDIAEELFSDFDVIIDGTDDIDTKYLANSAARAVGKPLIFGALSQWEGQLSVFDPRTDGPCYACVFPTRTVDGLALSCAEAGVIGPLPGVIGTMMAVEAIKLTADAGSSLVGTLFIYDALFGETRSIAVSRLDSCPDCGG